jgi:hypothetical protein
MIPHAGAFGIGLAGDKFADADDLGSFPPDR